MKILLQQFPLFFGHREARQVPEDVAEGAGSELGRLSHRSHRAEASRLLDVLQCQAARADGSPEAFRGAWRTAVHQIQKRETWPHISSTLPATSKVFCHVLE